MRALASAARHRAIAPCAGHYFSSFAFAFPPRWPAPPSAPFSSLAATDEALFASVRFLAEPCSSQRLDHVSLWEVLRLLKLEEEMRGVAGCPQLDAARLLDHARELLSALRWGPPGGGGGGGGAATPRDRAALHALAVFLADRRDAPPGGVCVRGLCEGAVSAAVAGTLRARAWPSVAVVDVAAALCPHGLLSIDALGTVLAFADAVGPAQLHLEDAVELFLAVSGSPQLRTASLAAPRADGASADAVAALQRTISELLLSMARRISLRLLAALKEPATRGQPALPLPQLVALAEQCVARFDGRGDRLVAEAPFSHPLLQLASAIAVSAAPGVRAIAAAAVAAAAAARAAQAGALPAPSPAEGDGTPGDGAPGDGAPAPRAAGGDAAALAAAAGALRLGRCLAAMGVWVDPLQEALGEAWEGLRGARLLTELPAGAANDALALASLSVAARRLRARAPPGWASRPPPAPFPPFPRRLSAVLARGRGGWALRHDDDLARAEERPALLAPSPRGGAGADALRRGFPAAWAALRAEADAALAGAAAAAVGAPALRAACAVLGERVCVVAEGTRGRAPFLTPEGVLLHAAVPRWKLGARLLGAADVRPSLDGLSAALLAELSVAEAAGWVVELVLEDAAEGGAARARAAAEALLAAELARRGFPEATWAALLAGAQGAAEHKEQSQTH
jgi:hypothetical protein